MNEKLSDENFLIYCAKHYDNPQCHSTEEFIEDLKRIKYIKKLITRYIDSGVLKDRLILNHLIILYNVFGAEHMSRILYLKMRSQFKYIKPFLIFMGVLPEKIYNIKEEAVINTDEITMDDTIVQALRRVKDD